MGYSCTWRGHHVAISHQNWGSSLLQYNLAITAKGIQIGIKTGRSPIGHAMKASWYLGSKQTEGHQLTDTAITTCHPLLPRTCCYTGKLHPSNLIICPPTLCYGSQSPPPFPECLLLPDAWFPGELVSPSLYPIPNLSPVAVLHGAVWDPARQVTPNIFNL